MKSLAALVPPLLGGGSHAGAIDGNQAYASFSVVVGGRGNAAGRPLPPTTIGESSTVLGGFNNTAHGESSTVSGGQSNTASGDRSSVSGGSNHEAAGEFDWKAGFLYQDF